MNARHIKLLGALRLTLRNLEDDCDVEQHERIQIQHTTGKIGYFKKQQQINKRKQNIPHVVQSSSS
jgi:hypothetical protein